jgi:hypothetical protein
MSRSSASKRLRDAAAIREFLDGIPDGSDASGDEDDDDDVGEVDESGRVDPLDEIGLVSLQQAGVDRYSGSVIVVTIYLQFSEYVLNAQLHFCAFS